ncbi:NADAR family protein [Vibrio parahaemolyticus]|nr:NADAR family protein [Vibrio parahaemolyticus]
MLITENFVFFYDKSEVYSQQSKHGFTYKGFKFKSAEHWMMFHKARVMILGASSTMKDVFEFMRMHPKCLFRKILDAKTPQAAKMLGRDVKPYSEEMWKENREDVVFYGNVLKFQQNKVCSESMATVGTKQFVEAAKNDLNWGVGLDEKNPKILNPKNWVGLNLLGKQLDRVNQVLFINPVSVEIPY